MTKTMQDNGQNNGRMTIVLSCKLHKLGKATGINVVHARQMYFVVIRIVYMYIQWYFKGIRISLQRNKSQLQSEIIPTNYKEMQHEISDI